MEWLPVLVASTIVVLGTIFNITYTSVKNGKSKQPESNESNDLNVLDAKFTTHAQLSIDLLKLHTQKIKELEQRLIELVSK